MPLPQVRVFPVVDLTSDAAIAGAARDALFGPDTQIFPGGWSFNDRALLERLAIVPPVVASQDIATEYGLAFLKSANAKWKKSGQESDLFPLDTSLFRLGRVEVRQIKKGTRPLAWRVSWIVLANMGAGAERLDGMKDGFIGVAQSVITLTVSLTGRIVGGSATWRPTLPPMTVDQKATPKALLVHLNTAAKSAPATLEHSHGDVEPAAGKLADIHYFASERSEFCNFIDPRISIHDHAEMHGPGLVVPMTDYGLAAQIVTQAQRTGADGAGQVVLNAWVTGCNGTISVNPPPAGYMAHWTFQDMTEGPEATYKSITGGAPLSVKGLAQAAFTVVSDKGAIAHAHAEICSQLDRVAMPRALV